MAADDLAKFIRQCVADSQELVMSGPSNPIQGITITDGEALFMDLGHRLVKRIVESSDMTLPDAIDIELSLLRIISMRDKQAEENKRLKEAVEYALHFASGHYDEGAQEDDPSPDDMTAHINGLIVKKCRETLTFVPDD